MYNVKIRFNSSNEIIKGDIGKVMTEKECVKNMHQYFLDHMDEDDVAKIIVERHDETDDRCKVVARDVWTAPVEIVETSDPNPTETEETADTTSDTTETA